MIAPSLVRQDIEDRVLELVAEAREHYRIPEGYDGASACTRLRLNLVYSRTLGEQDGSFDLRTRTVMLNQRRTRWRPRRQFTIYHEIMHYLLEREGHLLEYLIERYGDDREALRRAVEIACNVGAAEFLIPQDRMRRHIAQYGISLRTIEYTCRVYDASFTVAAIQLARCAPSPCITLICRQGSLGRQDVTGTGLHVHHASSSPNTTVTIARGRAVDEGHLFHDVWLRGGHRQGNTYVLGQMRPAQPCDGEAKRAGTVVIGILSWTESVLLLP